MGSGSRHDVSRALGKFFFLPFFSNYLFTGTAMTTTNDYDDEQPPHRDRDGEWGSRRIVVSRDPRYGFFYSR